MKKFHENVYRSITKTITFRLIIIILNSIVVYGFTHNKELTGGVVIISSITSTIAYFFHERLWNRVHWGKSAKHNGKDRMNQKRR